MFFGLLFTNTVIYNLLCPLLLQEMGPKQYIHDGVNLSTSLSPTSLAPSSDGFQHDIIDMWAAIGFINGEIPARIPQQVDLAHTIQEKVISIQGLLDASNVPITIQGKIFEQVFQKKEEHQHPFDYDRMGLVQLIALSGALISYIHEILEV